MKKDNKKLIIIISIMIIVVLIILIEFKIDRRQKYNEANANIYNTNKIENETTNEKNNIKDITNDTKDNGNLLNTSKYNSIIIVNNESINEKEKEFVQYQLNNDKNEASKDATEKLIEEYVILQNAKEKGIELSKSESERIEKNVKDTFERDMKEANEISKKFGMNYNEFLEFYTEREKKRQLILNWNSDMNQKINNGEIQIENEEFNNKYNEYKNTDNISKKYELLVEMKNIYKDYLKSKATIEYK